MFLRFLLFGGIAFIVTAAHAQNFNNVSKGSILICKDSQCVPSHVQMGRDYLVNQINELMKNNIDKNITVCEASPEKYTCTQQGFSFPVHSDLIQTTVTVSSAKIIDTKPIKEAFGSDLIIDYRLKAGDTFPKCQTSLTRIGVASATDVKMMSPRFNCKATETNQTTFSLTYNVNYLDLDRGIIGAFYSVAANNALQGSQNGYVLMALEKGVTMEPGEVFPYIAQLEAILNGTMPQINDSDTVMEAFWLKPTPFLNLITPQFAPNNCVEFEGGCSAEMLNNPNKAMPSAAQQIAALTPSGVPSTTGLIQQKMAVLNDGDTSVQKLPIQNPIPNKKAAENETPQQVSSQMIKNGEKEYQLLQQFENQNTGNKTSISQATPQAAQAAAHQLPATQQQSAVISKQPVSSVEKPAAQIQILTQPGVTLSAEERAYIEGLAQTAENQPISNANIDVQTDLPHVITEPTGTVQPNAVSVVPKTEAVQTPPAAVIQSLNQRSDFEAPVYVVPSENVKPADAVSPAQKPVVITPSNTPVKEDTSLWNRFKRNVSDFLYW